MFKGGKTRGSVTFDLVDQKTLVPSTMQYFTVGDGSVYAKSSRIYNLCMCLPMVSSGVSAKRLYIKGVKLMATFSRVVRPTSVLCRRSVAYRVVMAGSPVFDSCNQRCGQKLLPTEGRTCWKDIGSGYGGFEIENGGEELDSQTISTMQLRGSEGATVFRSTWGYLQPTGNGTKAVAVWVPIGLITKIQYR